MITIVITGIVMGLVSTNIGGLRRITSRFNEQTAFKEQYLIFLLKFEEDYQQAEIKNNSEIHNLDDLVFYMDHNLDGDYSDSGERISYRWNSSKKRIDRKSGDGKFQAFLDGVSGFSWARTSTVPICHQLTILDLFSQWEKVVDYCRASL